MPDDDQTRAVELAAHPGRGPARPVLVLGLGNPILTDDAVGLLAAREVRALLGSEDEGRIEVEEANIAGFALLDLLEGRSGAVILDAIEQAGTRPGTILERSLADFRPTSRLVAGHQVDLPTAVALGLELGRPMPEQVVVIGVVVKDARTFGEEPTAPVAGAVRPAAERALVLARRMAAGWAAG